jgi:hypothetical protein
LAWVRSKLLSHRNPFSLAAIALAIAGISFGAGLWYGRYHRRMVIFHSLKNQYILSRFHALPLEYQESILSYSLDDKLNPFQTRTQFMHRWIPNFFEAVDGVTNYLTDWMTCSSGTIWGTFFLGTIERDSNCSSRMGVPVIQRLTTIMTGSLPFDILL